MTAQGHRFQSDGWQDLRSKGRCIRGGGSLGPRDAGHPGWDPMWHMGTGKPGLRTIAVQVPLALCDLKVGVFSCMLLLYSLLMDSVVKDLDNPLIKAFTGPDCRSRDFTVKMRRDAKIKSAGIRFIGVNCPLERVLDVTTLERGNER